MSRMSSASGRRSGRWSLVRVAATVHLAAVAVALVVAAVVAVLSDVPLLRAWGVALMTVGALLGSTSSGYLDRALSVQDEALLSGHRPAFGADRSLAALTPFGAFLVVGVPLVVVGTLLLDLG